MSASQLLTSALIYIHDRKHTLIKCRALLDTCATANFISESIVRRLDLPVTKHTLPIGTIGTMSTESRGIVQITIQAIRDGFQKNLTCLTIPTISNLIPAEDISTRFDQDTSKHQISRLRLPFTARGRLINRLWGDIVIILRRTN